MRLLKLLRNINIDRLRDKLNRSISKKHQQYLQGAVLHEAATYAAKDLPDISDESIEPYVASFRGFYNQLKKEISAKLKGSIKKMQSLFDNATFNLQMGSLSKAIGDWAIKINHLELDYNRIHVVQDFTMYNRQRWILYTIAYGESLWTMAAFLGLGDMYILSAIFGMVVGFSQVIGVKYAIQYIREIEDEVSKRIWAIGASLFYLLVITLLGMVRYWFVHHGVGAAIPFLFVNPMTFVGINTMFVIGSGFLVLLSYPSKEDENKIIEKQKLSKKIQKARSNQAALELQLSNLQEARNSILQLNTEIAHAEAMLHEKIDAFYDEAIGTFKHENTVKRKSGYPVAFKNAYEPLQSFHTEYFSFQTING